MFRSPAKLVFVVLGILGLSVLLPVGTLVCLLSLSDAGGGHAPQKDFTARRAWGERLYRPYLEHLDRWAANSALIRRDVGEVQRLAPVGFNKYHSGFTDGGYATMNLEVIGPRGTGILHLPQVEIWSTGQLHSIGEDATWTCHGKTEFIVSCGRSYLDAHGLEDAYAEIIELAATDATEQFFEKWNEFQSDLDECSLQPNRRPNGRPQPVDALRDEYREPLLASLGDMMARVDRAVDSAEVYRLAADTMLSRANDELQAPDDVRDMSHVADELRQANELLRKAERQVPGDKKTRRLARTRVQLWYVHSIGSRRHPVFAMGEDEEQRVSQAWAEKSLGIFYTEAVRFAVESPYLNEQMPGMKVSIYRQGGNVVNVNYDNCYSANVYLRLSNRRTTGTLTVRIREDEDRCQPIDVFADTPRALDYPLVIRSPYWEPDGNQRIKLSAKTGAPKHKNRRTINPSSIDPGS